MLKFSEIFISLYIKTENDLRQNFNKKILNI